MESKQVESRVTSTASLIEVSWIVALFFLLGGWRTPDVNEAHYLLKARHYWDPQFCAGDAFLESRNGHVVFFTLIGWLTLIFPFSTVAWIGRFMAWTCLAAGWQRLAESLGLRQGASLLGAALWILLTQWGQMSGEWILGGCEAKVFAYAALLAGMASMARGTSGRTCIWFGIATAWHVLVGGWASLLAMAAWWWEAPRDWRRSRHVVLPWSVGLAIALWGIVPALLLDQGVTADVRAEAHTVYVWERLSHHLLLRAFPSWRVARHVGLMMVFMGLARWQRDDRRAARAGRIIWGSIGLVIAGAIIDACAASTTWGTGLLRFYWFRSSDALVPLGCSVWALLGLQRMVTRQSWRGFAMGVAMSAWVVWQLLITTWSALRDPVPPADWQGGMTSVRQWRDWTEMCQWIQTHVPTNARVLTPISHQTFKWYAQRAELVTNKDVPQDAAALLAWRDRLTAVRQWQQSLSSEEYSQRLREIMTQYQCSLVVLRTPSYYTCPQLQVLHQNPHYLIGTLTRTEPTTINTEPSPELSQVDERLETP